MQNAAILEDLEPWEADDDEIILSEVFDAETLAALAMIEAGATYEQIEKSRQACHNAARKDGEAGALDYRVCVRERFESSGRDISEFAYENDLDDAHLAILGYHQSTATDARNVTRRHKARGQRIQTSIAANQLKCNLASKAPMQPQAAPQAPNTPVLQLVPPVAPEPLQQPQNDAQTLQIARLLLETADAAKVEKRAKEGAREAAKTTRRKMEMLREVMAPLAKPEVPPPAIEVPPIPDRDFLPYLRDAKSVFESVAARNPQHAPELLALWRAGVSHFKDWANAENQRMRGAMPSGFILRAWVQWMNYKAHETTNWR